MTSSRRASGRGVVLVATRSAGKFAELRAPLEALGFHVMDLDAAGVRPSPDEDAIEVHDSFEANASAKAHFYAAASGGVPTIADDSGLVVDALGGEPGVRSRRWSGVTGPEPAVSAANNEKLLRELKDGMPRDARFVCAVAYVDAPNVVVERGETRGRIALMPRGEFGFGYDPLFEAADLGWRTFGEATAVEKDRVSHRARALARLYRQLGGPGAGNRGAG